jgi:hypothetical protein
VKVGSKVINTGERYPHSMGEPVIGVAFFLER